MALQTIGAPANWVPAKTMTNGKPYYGMQVAAQITPGWTQVDPNEFLQGAAKQVGGYNGETNALAQYQSDPKYSSVIQNWQQGNMNTPSNSVQAKDTTTGQTVWTTQDAVQQQGQLDADIASGKMVQIAPGRYAPAGSAATTNPLGVNNATQQNAQAAGAGTSTPGAQTATSAAASTPGVASTNGGTAASGAGGITQLGNTGSYMYNGVSYSSLAFAQQAQAAATGGTPGTSSSNGLQSALDIINNSNEDPSIKAYYSQIVKGWDPNQEYSPQAVLDAVKKIQSGTIDPHFQELGNTVKDQISRSVDATNQARQLELQGQTTNAQQAIQGAQNNLEASGLSRTGEAVKQLGATSTYAQSGTQQAAQSAIPVQTTPFGGAPTEGLVNQSNRLISSSSANRYQQNLTDLSRSAEQQLGTVGSAGLVGGVQQQGGVTGSLVDQKTQATSSALNSELGLNAQKTQQDAPLNIF